MIVLALRARRRCSINRMARALPVLLVAVGCHSWSTYRGAPQNLVDKHPTSIRVTRVDGSQLELVQAGLRVDTLVGLRAELARKDSTAARTAIPFADIRELAVRRFDPLRTALTAGVGLAAVIAVASDVDNPPLRRARA